MLRKTKMYYLYATKNLILKCLYCTSGFFKKYKPGILYTKHLKYIFSSVGQKKKNSNLPILVFLVYLTRHIQFNTITHDLRKYSNKRCLYTFQIFENYILSIFKKLILNECRLFPAKCKYECFN